MSDDSDVTLDMVISALASVQQTQHDHDVARDRYDGYSWDYFGAALAGEVEIAKTRLADRLDRYIDQRIAAVAFEAGLRITEPA